MNTVDEFLLNDFTSDGIPAVVHLQLYNNYSYDYYLDWNVLEKNMRKCFLDYLQQRLRTLFF